MTNQTKQTKYLWFYLNIYNSSHISDYNLNDPVLIPDMKREKNPRHLLSLEKFLQSTALIWKISFCSRGSFYRQMLKDLETCWQK